MFRRFTRSIAAVASVATIGLFAIPEVAHAANIDITVSGADGAIARAMVAVLNADGDAIDSVIADSTGKVTIDDTGAASLVVAANGYQTKVVTPVAAGTVTLTASTKSKLSFSNAYGGQVKPNGLAADGESGVFYATTDAQPSVWRTTDYAGTWAPVPTSADSTEATAAAAGAMPQENANEVFTSAVPGEVAVNTNQSLYFSRTYGNTWTKIDNYNTVTGQNKKHFWVHGGSSGDSSIIFVRTSTGLFASVVPDSVTDTTPPSFVNVTATLGSFYAAGDDVAFAVGSTGNMYMFSVNGSGAKLAQLSLTGSAISAAAAAENIATLNSHSLTRTGDTLVKLSTLGGATPRAFLTHSGDGSTTFSVGYFNGTTWDVSGAGALVGTDQPNLLTLAPYTNLQGKCGHNGNTALVGSIVNDLPTTGEVLFGAEVVGTIGQCMFFFNASGGAVSLGATSVANTKVALLPMGGANNNTGFAWDAGFNFSDNATTGNMVSLSGDGKYGIRKSALIANDGTKGDSFRPQFGNSNPSTTELLATLATAGKGMNSGGVAVTGLSGPNVTDVVYDPNSADGSRLVLSMTDTGGGRTLISTDGGTSFSTLGASGSRSLDWWNGAGGVQHIAATFTLGSDYMQVKSFKTTTGDTALDMGDELAATASIRDGKDTATRKAFIFGSTVTQTGGGQITATNFIPSGGTTLNTAIEGIIGKDRVLVGVTKCTGSVGPTGCDGSSGTVGLLDLSVNATSGAVTASSIKYYGPDAVAGAATAPANGTYAGAVTAIQYCPTGSATKVVDTAFIAVSGKGVYTMTGLSGTPSHSAAPIATGSYTELKVDCDTGLIGVAGSTGVFLSVDGGAKFFELKTSAATGNQPAIPTTALAVQADATSGDVTVAVGSGNGDVKSIETTFTDMGLKGSEVAAGTATSPTAAVAPKVDQVNEVNSASTGKTTGQVPDLELPPAAGDKVSVSSVKTFTVRAQASAGVKLAVGTAGGAFRATVKNGSITSPQTPAAQTPAAQTPASQTPTAPAVQQPTVQQPTVQQPTIGAPAAAAPKTVTITAKKIITVASALRTLGIAVVAKSKVVPTSTTKTVCAVLPGVKVKGLKSGICRLTVKITPPPTKKV
ncbi:MAG: hypothetical protein KJS66_08015, partial [Acidobacteria bacterium]|nr:hypothetical protein [Acidobacteriota bacterium]